MDDRSTRGRIRRASRLLGLLCLALLVGAPAATAASREPIAVLRAALHDPQGAAASAWPRPAEIRSLEARGRSQDLAVGGDPLSVYSTAFGPAQEASVTTTLARLDHGPEINQLSVYVASPDELASICGATIVACYEPSQMEMVVSGLDRSVGGVPRDFAIAHEYGHHIANTQHGDLRPSLEAGTIRWATYERVCQLTRADKLFPGNQGAHYWEDPDEAFAESYAHLTDPTARVAWQYTPLLRPTRASLAKLQADISRPWQGPTTTTWNGSVSQPAPAARPRRFGRAPRAHLLGAVAVAPRPGTDSRVLPTPLDGTVSVSVQAPVGANFAVVLRDAADDRVLARSRSGEGGIASLSYANCGHDALRLEVRSLQGSGSFQATIVSP